VGDAKPELAVYDAVGGEGAVGVVDVHDGQGGGVALGILEQHAVLGVAGLFVLASDVYQEGVAVTGRGLVSALVIAPHQGLALRWEHASLGVDGLQKVLSLDQRVVAAQLVHSLGHVEPVGGDLGADLVGVGLEDALDAVALLRSLEVLDLGGQHGIRGPGGAKEGGGDVGGGAHRVEVLAPLLGRDVLGLVAFE